MRRNDRMYRRVWVDGKEITVHLTPLPWSWLIFFAVILCFIACFWGMSYTGQLEKIYEADHPLGSVVRLRP